MVASMCTMHTLHIALRIDPLLFTISLKVDTLIKNKNHQKFHTLSMSVSRSVMISADICKQLYTNAFPSSECKEMQVSNLSDP